MQDLLFTLGLALFLLGLITGLVIPVLKNPRMGVSGHMVGMTNGPFLIVVGLLWPYLDLSHLWEVVAVVLLAYSGYANWLAMQLGAVWGACRKFAPGVIVSTEAATYATAAEGLWDCTDHAARNHRSRLPFTSHLNPQVAQRRERCVVG